jgi:hypothetical protein
MGLDVYAGSLSLYYMREWQLEVEQLVAEHPDATVEIDGVTYRLDELEFDVHEVKGEPSFKPASWPAAIEAVEQWRRRLGEAMQNPGFDWPEDEDGGYITRKITWDCYLALLLWAAHEEHPELPLPAMLPENPEQDPALVASRADQKGSRYPHLLGGTEIWLPVEDGRTFRGVDPGGVKRDYGFVVPLFTELLELNEATWKADPQTFDSWWGGGPPDQASGTLEDKAKFGWAVLSKLAVQANRHRFVLVLDY